MHELGIALRLAEAVTEVVRDHPGARVVSVRVNVGSLRAIEPEVMRFAWAAAARDTPAEGAALELKSVPAAGRCRGCGAEFEVEDLFFVCPACDGVDVETLRGNELVLEQVVFA